MIQTFFDFPVYFKFFIGLFALVNPVGIIPVFISMTSYQTAAARNKTNLTANLSVAIILWISLFLGDTILQLFGISIDSIPNAISNSPIIRVITLMPVWRKTRTSHGAMRNNPQQHKANNAIATKKPNR